jgi:H+/Cl- antiporter ClcA
MAPACGSAWLAPAIQGLRRAIGIALLGVAVGLACWPLNTIDRWQDALVGRLPSFGGSGWFGIPLALALAPIGVLPLLLALQAGVWRRSVGSGLPQLILALERPEERDQQLSAARTAARLALWSLASLALLPIGREGPAAQLGATIAHRLGRGRLSPDLLAAAAGAGLAGAFNTPLVGVIFVAEELTRRFQAQLIWPCLLMAALAAELSDLGGQPLFALGLHTTPELELDQLLWALPIGLASGALGGVMARLLRDTSRLVLPLAQRRPVGTGLVVGAALTLLALISGGFSCGDGETLLRLALARAETLPIDPPALLLAGPGNPEAWARWGLVVGVRLIGPVLSLAAGVPGGLIDPAFSLGGTFGGGLLVILGGPAMLGVLMGMAATLAGATQLPVLSLVFAIRVAGAQQLLPGLLLASLFGAVAGRLLMPVPIYRALEQLNSERTHEEPRDQTQQS